MLLKARQAEANKSTTVRCFFIGNNLTEVIETTYNHAASWNAGSSTALQALTAYCLQ